MLFKDGMWDVENRDGLMGFEREWESERKRERERGGIGFFKQEGIRLRWETLDVTRAGIKTG